MRGLTSVLNANLNGDTLYKRWMDSGSFFVVFGGKEYFFAAIDFVSGLVCALALFLAL
jgi:hypothetical protein